MLKRGQIASRNVADARPLSDTYGKSKLAKILAQFKSQEKVRFKSAILGHKGHFCVHQHLTRSDLFLQIMMNSKILNGFDLRERFP